MGVYAANKPTTTVIEFYPTGRRPCDFNVHMARTRKQPERKNLTKVQDNSETEKRVNSTTVAPQTD